MRKLLLCLLLLTSCAKPEIEIDASELNASLGSQPIGLLEVRHANSGSAGGIAFTESIGESAFCTATLLSTGEVATSSDCLQSEKTAYNAEDMVFHVNHQQSTKHYQVDQVKRVDAPRNLAYLTLKEAPNLAFGRSVAFQRTWPMDPEDTAAKPLPVAATAVSVPGPDKNGKTKIVLSSLKIEVAAAMLPITAPEDKQPAEGSEEEEAKIIKDAAKKAAEEDPKKKDEMPPAEHPLARPRALNVKGLKETVAGAPVFAGNQMVGIVKGGRSNAGNVQWIVGQ